LGGIEVGFSKKDADELLVKVGRRCCICHKLHRVQLHHIVPQAEGGSDDIDNAIALCPECHDEVHTRYAPGRVTRVYSVEELKAYKQKAIELVASGCFCVAAREEYSGGARAGGASNINKTIAEIMDFY
jgi:hypothetical protein